MKTKLIIFCTSLLLAFTACNNTPTRLRVINNYPSGYVKVLEEGKTDSTMVYQSYSAKVYYGQDHILSVGPNQNIIRRLESRFMNRPVMHLQVDLIDNNTQKTAYPLFFDQKLMFESDWEYTLTITKNGGEVTRSMVEGAK